MEQLVYVFISIPCISFIDVYYSALGSDGQAVEEEYVYDLPGSRRRPKVPPPIQRRSEL
jgi:hypothetical protein